MHYSCFSTLLHSFKKRHYKEPNIYFILFCSNYYCVGGRMKAAFLFKSLHFLKPFVIDESSLPRKKTKAKTSSSTSLLFLSVFYDNRKLFVDAL